MEALRVGIRAFAVTGPFTVVQAKKARRAFARAGHPDAQVTATRTIRVEGCDDPSLLMQLFANSVAGEKVVEIDPGELLSGTEVAYRLSVIDPETLTGLEVAEALNVKVGWIRMGWLYEVTGVDDAVAKEVIETRLCNPVVETLVLPGAYQSSLRPTGIPEAMQRYDLIGKSDAELEKLSADAGWYASLPVLKALMAYQEKIKRPLTDAEVEMIVQTWGDHCFHTTWKGLGLFAKLMATTMRIKHRLCRSIFSDNAGAMFFYDGWVIFIKGETHNHPSSIATFGGIQTKHGGLLRDLIFMMTGGYPLGCSTIMGTRLPSEDPASVPAGAQSGWTILTESIEGTRTYNNPMGVPQMGPLYQAHPGYAKCLALGVGIGFAPEDSDKKDPREGDVLILIGGSTGRDGIHGATASSANLTAEMVAKEGATVQIGNPITERKFTTLVPVLRDKGWLRYVTDLGAGGLSCAVGETVKDCGADVCLDGLPLKDASLAPREKWVSESQERGLWVVDRRHRKKVLALCKRYGVQAFVLGTCRSDRRLVVTDAGETIVDIDLDWLWTSCPVEKLTVKNPGIRRRRQMMRQPALKEWRELFFRIAADYACCDKSWATNQFDSTVQGRTVVGPLINGVPSDAFVSKPLRNRRYGAVYSAAFNPRWSSTDPVGSVANLLALSISQAVAIGVAPEDMVLCGNWYTATRTPELRWYLKQMVHRLCRFTAAVGIPVVSGKDSSSGSYKTADGEYIDVPPTLVPSTLGRMPDVRRVCNKVWKSEGDSLYLLRPCGLRPSMAGSVYASLVKKDKAARLPSISSDTNLLRLWQLVASERQHFQSIAAIGEGGAFMQLLHGCVASGFGADIRVPWVDWDLMGECPGSFLISVAPSENHAVRSAFDNQNLMYLGYTTAEPGIEIVGGSGRALSKADWPTLIDGWRSRFIEEVQG